MQTITPAGPSNRLARVCVARHAACLPAAAMHAGFCSRRLRTMGAIWRPQPVTQNSRTAGTAGTAGAGPPGIQALAPGIAPLLLLPLPLLAGARALAGARLLCFSLCRCLVCVSAWGAADLWGTGVEASQSQTWSTALGAALQTKTAPTGPGKQLSAGQQLSQVANCRSRPTHASTRRHPSKQVRMATAHQAGKGALLFNAQQLHHRHRPLGGPHAG